MNKRLLVTLTAICGLLLAIFTLVCGPEIFREPATVLAQNHDASDEQITGPYEVVKDWPKPVATLFPEEKGWTWGSTQAVFAQNPNRIFISMRGELPMIKSGGSLNVFGEARNVEVPGLGEDGRNIWLTIPMPGVPARNASIGPMSSPGEPHVKFAAQEGRDYRWQHLVYAVDGEGNLVDDWSKWDKTFKRMHKILISPYDPEKRVWIDDDGKCAIFIFSNDGKQLLQTIGVPGTCGDNDNSYNR